jgi:hypothetical protein
MRARIFGETNDEYQLSVGHGEGRKAGPMAVQWEWK